MSERKSILIVDDIVENLDLLKKLIAETDCDIYTSCNANQAHQLCQKIKFDLMLIDVRMPGVDGIEATRRIRKSSINSDSPVLFMVAKTDLNNISRAYKEGGVDIITKPFQSDELLTRLGTHLTLQEQKVRLQELVDTRDRFINILAHDLNSPFTTILGFTQLLAENLESFNKEELRRYLNLIHNVSENTHGLLNNLLSWETLKQNRIPFSPQKVCLRLRLDECCLLMRSVAAAKDIDIVVDVDEKIMLHADFKMLDTILRNLISNAIKFTPNSKRIIVSAIVKKDTCEIKISDSGIGMSDDVKSKLFKLGEETSVPGTNGEKGTGFGLILCNEFVRKHGGSIRVESEVGKGSHFIFSLPLFYDELSLAGT
ncbi:hybrid sensor histidine kinase/response regulator [Carboxylicivirga sp. M1479]|uniref:hybrid sensor histidine kinase/response regulator n=1 Tax=Carboxylicivirga sp. M1479 TaxID=2594476 RepID=UPI0011777ED8|nr:hybrid sensor histidine kinase/response regulator [Carboxylicivirga sp. M1479]TRX62499.1 hybrid sensor histidine kinase/response regulator [Carboxylicivirga sp. M1479]